MDEKRKHLGIGAAVVHVVAMAALLAWGHGPVHPGSIIIPLVVTGCGWAIYKGSVRALALLAGGMFWFGIALAAQMWLRFGGRINVSTISLAGLGMVLTAFGWWLFPKAASGA